MKGVQHLGGTSKEGEEWENAARKVWQKKTQPNKHADKYTGPRAAWQRPLYIVSINTKIVCVI